MCKNIPVTFGIRLITNSLSDLRLRSYTDLEVLDFPLFAPTFPEHQQQNTEPRLKSTFGTKKRDECKHRRSWEESYPIGTNQTLTPLVAVRAGIIYQADLIHYFPKRSIRD
jgi:hypothetical protein